MAYRDAEKERATKARYNKARWAAKDKMQARSELLRWTYGITHEDYLSLLEKQEGRCAICKTDDPKMGRKHFCVDHCHITGVVRGLLCHRCNLGIGHLQDDAGVVRQALAYLEKANG